MPEHPKAAQAPEAGRPVIVLDGIHRGEVGTVVLTGGGLVWVRLAGIPEPVGFPAASVDLARSVGVKVERPPQP